jgi:hypothetical protein
LIQYRNFEIRWREKAVLRFGYQHRELKTGWRETGQTLSCFFQAKSRTQPLIQYRNFETRWREKAVLCFGYQHRELKTV